MDDESERSLPHDFDAEITAVRDQLAAMAARCGRQLHLALDAFWTGSKKKRVEVDISENAVDEDEKSVDALVLRTLALRQPVASDLRMLTASFKLVTDLERIGDEAVDIARMTVSSARDGEPIRERLRRMAESAEEMFAWAVNSFVDKDSQTAQGVRRANSGIDALYREILDESVVFVSRHPAEIASALSGMSVARSLQRVAGHAVNIADGALFVVQGEPMPR